MPKRTVVELAGQKYVVLPYTGFRNLGLATLPEASCAAVPLFDSVAQSLVEPIRQQQSFDEDLKAQGVAGVGALLRRAASGSSAATASEAKRLEFEDKLSFPFLFFRGERREEYGILPTSYRQLANTPPDGHAYLLARQARVERRLARKISLAILLTRVSRMPPAQSRAAAWHYGAASTLLDFSFDPRVAAYFAHPKFNAAERKNLGVGQKPVGILYGLSYDHLQRCFPTQGWMPDGTGSSAITFYFVGTTVDVPYLAFDEARAAIEPATCRIAFPPHFANIRVTLRTVSVPSVKRIRGQQGLFIELVNDSMEGWLDSMRLWYFLDFLSDKWCFFRSDGQYEDAPNITAQTLFPTDSLLLRLAVWPRR